MFLISFFKALGRNSRSLINFANVCTLGQTIITLFEKKVMPDCCISASTCLILSGGGAVMQAIKLLYIVGGFFIVYPSLDNVAKIHSRSSLGIHPSFLYLSRISRNCSRLSSIIKMCKCSETVESHVNKPSQQKLVSNIQFICIN